MPLKINAALTAQKLVPKLNRLFELSAQKIVALENGWNPAGGAPVFTVRGQYTTRGWTDWTQGFQFGSALLQFDATREARFLEIGRAGTRQVMARHLTHIGVHDHGFNNISTYGNLLRLMREGRIPFNECEKDFYELALKTSGAVQAARWTRLSEHAGYIYSFNGPHSLFIDTLRSLRSLALAHRLGHALMVEGDRRISLLERLVRHGLTTARYNVYYGQGRDAYDTVGRVAQEAVFNVNDGSFRCPNSQQGWSPFTTWARGLAWAILGFAEELEFIAATPAEDLEAAASPSWVPRQLQRAAILPRTAKRQRIATTLRGAMWARVVHCRQELHKAAVATAEFYLANACADGIPLWDTGAPMIHRLRARYPDRPANPFNRWEPVDSSAAAIAAQGLIRLGNYLLASGGDQGGGRYRQAGLTIADALFDEPYLSTRPKHQGLLLHSIYHRPNGWDYIAPGQAVPNGESSMWGDYHARELGLLLLREARGEKYLTFFGGLES